MSSGVALFITMLSPILTMLQANAAASASPIADALFDRDELLDLDDGIGVEGAWVIDEVTAFEGAEAGIEVIEALIGQPERDDAEIEGFGEGGMRAEIGAHAVADPEQAAFAVEEGVAFALERDVAGEIGDLEPGVAEPFFEMFALVLALAVEEAADDGFLFEDDAAIGGEDHVREAGSGLDEIDVDEFGEAVVEGLPLGDGVRARYAVNIAGHPRVDDVFNPVVLRRTHENPPFSTHPGG